MGQSLILPGPEATRSFAAALAAALPVDATGWAILLNGELGAGKSTFARALLQALGHDGKVPSPTYTLVEPYTLPGYAAYHIDLYRIESVDELEFLGWSDLQDGLQLIEWPERAPHLGREADIQVEFSYVDAGRAAELTGLSERGASVLSSMDQPNDEVTP